MVSQNVLKALTAQWLHLSPELYFRAMKAKMRGILGGTVALLLVTGCGDQKSTPDDAAPANPYEQISAVYRDTLPCEGCKGILTDLTLYPDSTFAMRERYLGSDRKRGVGSYGRFLLEDSGRLRLEALHGQWVRYYQPGDGHLLMLDEQGKPFDSTVDYTLERTEEKVDTAGFRNAVSAGTGAPGIVYRETARGEAIVDESFIRSSGEPLRAIVAFYSLAHDTPCKTGVCPIPAALGMDDAGVRSMVSTWLAGNEKVDDVLTTKLRSGKLKLLHVFQSAGEYRVSSVVENSAGSVRRDDVFREEKGGLIWVSSAEGKVSHSSAARNPSRPAEYQQGGKQVIDPKRIREKPKKGSDGK